MSDGLRTSGAEIVSSLANGVLDGLTGWLLSPFLLLLRPIFADGLGQYLLALIVPVGLLFLLHETVVRSKVRFQEIALAHAVREAAKKSPAKRYRRLSEGRRRRVPFDLTGSGRAELAIVWKNLIQVTRLPVRWVVAGSLGLLLLAGAGSAVLAVPEVLFGIAGMIGAWGLFMAPWIAVLRLVRDAIAVAGVVVLDRYVRRAEAQAPNER